MYNDIRAHEKSFFPKIEFMWVGCVIEKESLIFFGMIF